MIEPMKRITVVALKQDQATTLKTLRDLEILHIRVSNQESAEFAESVREYEELQGTILILNEHKNDDADAGKFAGMDLEELTKVAEETLADHEKKTEQLHQLKREHDELLPWGDFDPKTVKQLKAKGVDVRLCIANADQMPEIPEDASINEISREKSTVHFVVISNKPIDIELPEVRLPKHSLSELSSRVKKTRDEIKALEAKLSKLATQTERLEESLIKLAEDSDYVQARDNLNEEGELEYITGYIPANRKGEIVQMAYRRGWGVLLEDPEEDERDVPTLLRVPKWLKVSKPIFDFVGIRPGYREFDISAWFLVFLTIFYAMIFGDAGYGAIFLVIMLVAKFVAPKKAQVTINLMLIFSAATLIWGLLSGSIFGIDPELLKPYYEKVGAIRLFEWTQERKNVQMLCFLIGAIHLTIAHGWRALVVINSPKALSQVGWICFIWGNFFLGSSLIAPKLYPRPEWLWHLYIAAAVLVLLFSAPSWQIHKAVGKGFGELLGNAVNSFVDVLSYIRLFAVGLSSFYVAYSFNNMGVDLMSTEKGPVVAFLTILGGALVILFGHLLNIALASLGVLVHGIRLNTLEFSGHIGIEWAGIPFRAFARRRKNLSEK